MTNRIAALLAACGGFVVGMFATLYGIYREPIFVLLTFLSALTAALVLSNVHNQAES